MKAWISGVRGSSGVSPPLFTHAAGNLQCSLWAAYEIWNMCLQCEWIWGQELRLRCCLHARLAYAPEFNTFLARSIFRYIWVVRHVWMSLMVIVVMKKASILWVTSESVGCNVTGQINKPFWLITVHHPLWINRVNLLNWTSGLIHIHSFSFPSCPVSFGSCG